MVEIDNALPGFPLVESPLFRRILTSMDLEAAERDIAVSLNTHGYAVFDFPDPDIDARIERIRARLAPRYKDTGPSQDGVVYAQGRIQDAWINDPDVKAIAANPEVIGLLSKLYGRRAFPFQTLNFEYGTQQAFHTDAVHFSSIPPRFMCGVWLAMEDVTEGAGPLQYVPGSHRWPMIDNSMVGRRGWGVELNSAQDPFGQFWNAMIETEQSPIDHFLARKGQALIWCANLLHGGSPRTTADQTRWSQVTHYYFEDCIYYTPALSDEYLGRLHLRNLVSAADGLPRPNHYLGEDIEACASPRASAERRNSPLSRWFRKLIRAGR